MNNIETRCEMLDTEIEELKAKILSYEGSNIEDTIDEVIDLAMMLGEAYVYRDSIVTPKGEN